MAKYRWVGTHAQEVNVNGMSRMLAPGDFVEDFTDEDLKDPVVAELVESGMFMNIVSSKEVSTTNG